MSSPGLSIRTGFPAVVFSISPERQGPKQSALDSHTQMPFFCVLTVTYHSTHSIPEPQIKQIPAQSWTPKKSKCSFPLGPIELLSKAPAIGDPVSDAKDDMPHDMPVRVPSRPGSGHRLGKTEAGSVTRPAEQKPMSDCLADVCDWEERGQV